ncbi:MAG TPA: AEC family transporter [Armatimonadota bacterium]|jgi:hypothetical protein
MLAIILPIFVLIAIGYALRRTGVIETETSYRIVGLIMNVTYPATLFLALAYTPFPAGVWKAPLWSVVTLLGSGLVTLAYARLTNMDNPTAGSLVFASAFGNTGYLGVPLAMMAYGETARISAVVFDTFGVSMILYGFGFAILAAFGGEVFSWKTVLAFFRTPTFLSAAAALAVRAALPAWNAHFPEPWLVGKIVSQTLHLLMPLTFPLAAISLGVNLRIRAVTEYFPQVVVAVIAKVMVMPLLAYGLIRLLGPGGVTGQAIVLEAAMPGGLVVGVLCGRFGCNARLGAAITVGTTLATIVTLPFWTHLLGP